MNERAIIRKRAVAARSMVKRAHARLRRWRELAEIAKTSEQKAQAQAGLENAKASLARYQQDLSNLEQQREQIMRHQDEYTPQSGNASWPWRAWVTLQIGDRKFSRGQVIPDELIESGANMSKLISSGYVRRLPDAPTKPAPAPAAKPVPPIKPLDHVAIARREIRRIARERGTADLAAVEDLVPAEIMQRARVQHANRPRIVQAGAWGSQAGPTPTGQGSSRRITDDFRAVLFAPEEAGAV